MSVYAEKNRKTRQLIQGAFLTLLVEKRFESITIANITTVANINRGTFYLHYADKYDLLEQVEQQLFEDIGSHIDQLQSRYSAMDTFEKEQEHLASTLFSSIENHAPLLKKFLGEHGRAGFHLRFRNAFSEKVRVHLGGNRRKEKELHIPIDYLLSFITSAFLGLIEQWMQNDLDKTPQEMTKLYIDIILFIRGKE